MKDAARKYYGAPLREWVKLIAQDRAALEKAVRQYQAEFIHRHVPAGASGEVFRAAQRFALIGAAGEFATKAGLTGWQPDEAINAAGLSMANWLARRVGGSGSGDLERASVRCGVSSKCMARVVSNPRSSVTTIRACRYRKRSSTGPVFVLIMPMGKPNSTSFSPRRFGAKRAKAFDYRAVARALAERRYLDCQPPHLTKKPRLPEIGCVRVFAVNASILGDGGTGARVISVGTAGALGTAFIL